MQTLVYKGEIGGRYRYLNEACPPGTTLYGSRQKSSSWVRSTLIEPADISLTSRSDWPSSGSVWEDGAGNCFGVTPSISR
jgi:hypothetical protein